MGETCQLDKAWKAIREAAGLGKLRIHDLRHAYAAVAVNGGEVCASSPGCSTMSTSRRPSAKGATGRRGRQFRRARVPACRGRRRQRRDGMRLNWNESAFGLITGIS